MRRDEIVRRDFPTSRRGWDPDAVIAHLERVAGTTQGQATPLAEAASARVAAIVEAAEKQAAEIEAEARERAAEIVSEAHVQAERTAEEARERAREQAEAAQAAIADLAAQAERLREQMSSTGATRAAAVSASPASEVEPGPVTVPEPEPPLEPEPGPVRIPEPEPPLEPEPEPPDIPEPSPEPPEPPSPDEPPQPVASDGQTTEQLIEQLRAGKAGAPNGPAAAVGTDVASGDKAAARLVAMKMALDGAPREEIDRHLAEHYELESREKLLDDVLARAKA